MGFSDYWRSDRGRERSEQDRERERQRWHGHESGGQHGHGSEGYSQDDDYERRGWREGSDYYGRNPERYGERGYGGERGERRYEGQGQESQQRGGYGGQRDEGRGWRGGESDYSRDYGSQDWRGGSFNDRWQNAYVGNTTGGPYGQERESWRRSEEYGGMYGQRGMGQRYGSMQGGSMQSGQMSGSQGQGSQQSGSGRMWERQGQHSGKGPRGYRRSDERIREDVCECLTADDMIDASNMDVTVKECEVTLSGTVSSREDKRRAEDLAESISGVKDVTNNLRVSSESSRSESSQGKSYGQQQQQAGQSGQGSSHH